MKRLAVKIGIFLVVFPAIFEFLFTPLVADVGSKSDSHSGSHSDYNQWVLRGGIALSTTALITHDQPARPKSFHKGFTFSSQFGYRWELLELAIGQYCTISEVEDVQIRVLNSSIQSESANILDATFGPKFRYYTPWSLLGDNWQGYLTGGLYIGLIKLKFENASVVGHDYSVYQKLDYEGPGFTVGLGIQSGAALALGGGTGGWWQELSSNFPQVFYEVVYKFLRGSKATIEGGKKAEVSVVSVDNRDLWIKEHTVLLSIGMRFL